MYGIAFRLWYLLPHLQHALPIFTLLSCYANKVPTCSGLMLFEVNEEIRTPAYDIPLPIPTLSLLFVTSSEDSNANM